MRLHRSVLLPVPTAHVEPDHDDWRHQAACTTEDARAIHDLAITTGHRTHIDAAKAICNDTCPVRQDCLTAHLHEPWGVYGGYDRHERATIALGTTPQPPPVVGTCQTCRRPMMAPGTLIRAPKPLATLWRAQGYVTATDSTRGRWTNHSHTCNGCIWATLRHKRRQAS